MTESRFVITTLSVVFVICCAGCSSNLYTKADRPVVQTPQEIVKKPQPGTIWAGENINNSLFVDKRARRINDVVTVVVSESATGGNNASTDTSRDTSTAAGITSLLGIEQSILSRNANMGSSISVGGTTCETNGGANQRWDFLGSLKATISSFRVILISSIMVISS